MIMERRSQLILIHVDHGLMIMIMKEGVGWPTTDTCRQ
jgi:hypothetical protein